MKKDIVYVIDILKGTSYETTISNYTDIYPLINSDIFDVVERKLGSTYFTFYVDDIGLLRDNPIPSVFDINLIPTLYGNVVISKTNDAGETVSLSHSDINLIKSHLTLFVDMDEDIFFQSVLIGIEL